jgi:hypothetical protein
MFHCSVFSPMKLSYFLSTETLSFIRFHSNSTDLSFKSFYYNNVIIKKQPFVLYNNELHKYNAIQPFILLRSDNL